MSLINSLPSIAAHYALCMTSPLLCTANLLSGCENIDRQNTGEQAEKGISPNLSLGWETRCRNTDYRQQFMDNTPIYVPIIFHNIYEEEQEESPCLSPELINNPDYCSVYNCDSDCEGTEYIYSPEHTFRTSIPGQEEIAHINEALSEAGIRLFIRETHTRYVPELFDSRKELTPNLLSRFMINGAINLFQAHGEIKLPRTGQRSEANSHAFKGGIIFSKKAKIEEIIRSFGHTFALLDTFHEGNELANGSNTEITGDYIPDTPADPGLGYDGCLYDENTCTTTECIQDDNGDTYDPDPTNFMSSYPIICLDHFTPEQSLTMRCSAETQYSSISLAHGRYTSFDRVTVGCRNGKENDFTTIGEALQKVYTEGTVEVCEGTYFENINLSGQNSKFTITAQNNSNVTIESAFEGSPIFMISNGSHITLQKILLSNSRTCNMGCAIFVQDSTLLLVDSEISSCHANLYGGGIFALGSQVDLQDSVFRENIAARTGGAIYVSDTILNVSGCNLIDNLGIALQIVNSSGFNISKSNFATNAGALHLYNSTGSIEESSFNLNHALYGSALYLSNSSLQVSHTNFDTNSAEHIGGAIYLLASSFRGSHVKLANNMANSSSGIYVNASTLELTYPNIFGNSNSINHENPSCAISMNKREGDTSIEIENPTQESGQSNIPCDIQFGDNTYSFSDFENGINCNLENNGCSNVE